MDPALKTMIENMPSKTGKSLEEWKKILKSNPIEKHGEAVKFLKEKHGVTHGFANAIVALSKEDISTPDDLVESQYKGKENLLLIYKKILSVVKEFGNEVTITPKKTSVSLIRKKQFALVNPATKTRIDLGLKLVGKPETGRLGPSGPFGTMCTHRVQLTDVKEVDKELKEWLREAFDKTN